MYSCCTSFIKCILYFLPRCSLFFHYLSVFWEQKFLTSIKSELLICPYIDCSFGVLLKKTLLLPRSQRFSSMFSSRIFIVLGFIFQSWTHSELIYVYCVRHWSKSCCWLQISKCSAPLVEKTILSSPNCLFSSLWKLNCPYMYSVSLDSFLFHWSICLSWCQYYFVLTIVAL